MRVHSAFPRAINLMSCDEQFVSLLAQDAADGPFSLRLPLPRLPDVDSGAPARVEDSTLTVGPLSAAWSASPRWDPRLQPLEDPCFPLVPIRDSLIGAESILAQAFLALSSSADRPKGGSKRGAQPFPQQQAEEAARRLMALRMVLQADAGSLTAAVRGLLGYGQGGTPAGDDCLLGLLAAWRMVGLSADALKAAIQGQLASSRTTAISTAFLRAACNDHFAAQWHRLCEALQGGDEGQIELAARRALAYGATSGADALAGWLIGMAWG